MNTYDIDGCIYINDKIGGIYPGPDDVIITGRSYEERPETMRMLHARGILNPVYFNLARFTDKTRRGSGVHKGAVINMLIAEGNVIGAHFEDDEIQATEIRRLCPKVPVIMVVHDLTSKENVRHLH